MVEREVAVSIPGLAIPKALKKVPVATLLGAQHYNSCYLTQALEVLFWPKYHKVYGSVHSNNVVIAR